MFNVQVYDEIITITNETVCAVREKKAKHIQQEYDAIIDGTNAHVKLYPFMASETYLNELLESKKAVLKGETDKYLVFIQECIHIQTGRSVPLLEF